MSDRPDRHLLQLCVDLAREALEAGDDPFGSVLIDADGKILEKDRNRTVTGEKGDYKADSTLHPEFTLAKWAQLNLTPEQRASAAVYTSGEHCAMCSAAHAWVGLGRIVYASSTEQLGAWKDEFGVVNVKQKVRGLPINSVAPNIPVEGPIEGFDVQIKELHRRYYKKD